MLVFSPAFEWHQDWSSGTKVMRKMRTSSSRTKFSVVLTKKSAILLNGLHSKMLKCSALWYKKLFEEKILSFKLKPNLALVQWFPHGAPQTLWPRVAEIKTLVKKIKIQNLQIVNTIRKSIFVIWASFRSYSTQCVHIQRKTSKWFLWLLCGIFLVEPRWTQKFVHCGTAATL